jgi:hypothetical protein
MRVGNREIGLTGSVVANGNDPVEVEYANLRFKLVFEAGEKAAVKADGAGEMLTITLTSFDNALGVAWSAQVGKVAGKNLFLAVFIHTVGTPGQPTFRLVNYTFTLEEN